MQVGVSLDLISCRNLDNSFKYTKRVRHDIFESAEDPVSIENHFMVFLTSRCP